jgi:hypothetical protein
MSDEELSEHERRITTGTIGAFGRYLMERTFDEGVWSADLVLNGNPASPSDQALRERLRDLTADERQAVAELARDAVISALHGLLHGLSHDEDRIRLLFDGLDVAAASDGLHGDLFIWLRELSKYPYDVSADMPEIDFDALGYDFGDLDED